MLDLWDEVLVEWGFMLTERNSALFRMRQVYGMDLWLKLYYIHDHLLVHSYGHIPWMV